MKTWISFIFFSLNFCIALKSQSETKEFQPEFFFDQINYVSELIEFNMTFDDVSFVGISGYHFDEKYKNIEYRILYRGQWSGWKYLSPQHELGIRIRTAYEGGFIMSPFSALQFKSSDRFETPLNIRLFIGKKQRTGNILKLRSLSCDLPEVCERSCWCTDCPIDNTPQLTDPTHIIVHHSAGSNDPNLNFYDVVEYIWDLHVNTNGWDDIGYNWLIDPNGVLYEGRPNDYQGAHFSCINENTIGICLLGNFSSILPSEDALSTLVNLIGYEASEHAIDVLGESYHETGDFTLSNIAGHRDSSGSSNACSSTACPGDAFYPTLASIRDKVADLACYESPISSTQNLDKHKWSVFPNPFNSTIMIKTDENASSQIEIVDAKGRFLGNLLTNQSNDLGNLPRGIYFLIADGQILKKIIKL